MYHESISPYIDRHQSLIISFPCFFLPLLSFPYPLSQFHFTSTYCKHVVLSRLTLCFNLAPPHHILDKHILGEAPIDLENIQPKERESATEVTMGSLPKLNKTNPLMLGTLHHLEVIKFFVTRSFQDLILVILVQVHVALITVTTSMGKILIKHQSGGSTSLEMFR